MGKCLWCGKECPQTPGRRERLYCNGNCRASYSQKRSAELAREIRISEGFTGKPGRPRAGIPLKTKKLVKEEGGLIAIIEGKINTPEVKKLSSLMLNDLVDTGFCEFSDIDLQIAMIKDEVIPPERDTIMGRKIWKKEQEDRIKALSSKLHS